jgi:two-component system chemotaxis sensor kinase CheA
MDDGFLRPDELAEIRRTFFDQGREAVEALGREVLALEGQAATAERLKTLRRAAHTLKGDCASVGFTELSGLAHALEDAFVALEVGSDAVSQREADGLLDAVDALRQGLEAGAQNRPASSVQPAILRLRALHARGGEDGILDELSTEQSRKIGAARAEGRHALHVVAVFGRGCRDRAALARRLLRAAQGEVVAQRPTDEGLTRAAKVEVVIVAAESAADVRARLARVRGAKISVTDCPREAVHAGGEMAAPDTHDGETVRIEAARIDEALNLVGELVTVRSTLAGLGGEIEPYLPEDLAVRLSDAQSLLARVLQELQRSTMRMRMVPADRVFRRFARVVRDLGRQTGKRLSLHIEGESTELDRGILDALEEPLLHLVRNAVAHGVEEPDARTAAGKPEEARLTIRAGREGNQILVEVADDGRGIDVAAVKRRAVERGLLREEDAAAFADTDALQLIFRAGLSTAAVLSEHSGRGVGLDVVRDTVESLRGSVTAENVPGSGALFRIRVPLTIAIIQALLFRVAGRHFAVPLSSVVEIAQVAELTVQRVGAVELLRLRDQVLGLVRLSRLLGLPDGPMRGHVMVLQCGGDRFGLLADEVSGEQELVIKRVHDRWIRTPMIAGASIVGGGIPTLILDVLSVYRSALSQGAFSHD